MATNTYCLDGSKDVPDSFVIGHRFGATDTLRLRCPNTATDTLSISRNIKYTQTEAETGDIGPPETASGIGQWSYQLPIQSGLFVAYKVEFLQLLFWPVY
jgi:hypothetical protein